MWSDLVQTPRTTETGGTGLAWALSWFSPRASVCCQTCRIVERLAALEVGTQQGRHERVSDLVA